MSDAKAAAEARRLKILARSKTSSVTVASSDDVVDETLYNALANPSGNKEKSGEQTSRPIAERRRRISTKSTTIDTTAASPAVSPTKPADDDDSNRDAGVVSKFDVLHATLSNHEEPSSDKGVTTVAESEDKTDKSHPKTLEQIEREVSESTEATGKVDGTRNENREQGAVSLKASAAIPPAKTMEQIEEEIRKGTMESDASVKKNGKKIAASSKDSKVSATVGTNALKVKPIAIDPSNIMRFIRVIMIIALAAFTGYRTVQNSRLEAIKMKAYESVITKPGDDFDFQNSGFQMDPPIPMASISVTSTEGSLKPRTWGEYFQDKLTGQAECSVTAVGLVWWMSRFFSPVVTSQFKQESKQMKPLEMAMEFLTNGINAFKETIYSSIGEVALHFFVLITSVTLFTLYFSNEMSDAGTGNSASITNIEL